MKNKLILVGVLAVSAMTSMSVMWLVWTGIFWAIEATA